MARGDFMPVTADLPRADLNSPEQSRHNSALGLIPLHGIVERCNEQGRLNNFLACKQHGDAPLNLYYNPFYFYPSDAVLRMALRQLVSGMFEGPDDIWALRDMQVAWWRYLKALAVDMVGQPVGFYSDSFTSCVSHYGWTGGLVQSCDVSFAFVRHPGGLCEVSSEVSPHKLLLCMLGFDGTPTYLAAGQFRFVMSSQTRQTLILNLHEPACKIGKFLLNQIIDTPLGPMWRQRWEEINWRYMEHGESVITEPCPPPLSIRQTGENELMMSVLAPPVTVKEADLPAQLLPATITP